MSRRHAAVIHAWREFAAALRRWLSDSAHLAWCRLMGGHQFGTWRDPHPTALAAGRYFPHTWCSSCGWCQQDRSFDEERIGAAEGWYAS